MVAVERLRGAQEAAAAVGWAFSKPRTGAYCRQPAACGVIHAGKGERQGAREKRRGTISPAPAHRPFTLPGITHDSPFLSSFKAIENKLKDTVIALYDSQASSPQELVFEKGDVIFLTERDAAPGWSRGHHHATVGEGVLRTGNRIGGKPLCAGCHLILEDRNSL